MRSRRRTWVWGGGGLIAAGTLGMLGPSLPWPAVFLPDVVYLAAVVLLAVGLSREASVVARRPLGVVALIVGAAWPLVTAVATVPLSAVEPLGGPDAAVSATVALAVALAADIIAVTQIGRAGTVSRPWRWAPLWALCAYAAAWLLPQFFAAAFGTGMISPLVESLMLVMQLAYLLGTIGLGALAIALGSRARTPAAPERVYP